ncbi:patatin family protein [Spongisporangium articulatum]|uniref:Patatin family protein n=1 Tax=Spongisporangium articulatum TaxID=3362603 RepID=A0ABW8ATV4_9ACTN
MTDVEETSVAGPAALEPVLDLLARRLREGSRPGHRTDGARLALVIEGGSSRATYSHGMAIAVEQLGLLPCFDAVYGSSAGAIIGAFLLAGQSEFSIAGWLHPNLMSTFIRPSRVLRGGVVADIDYLLNTAYVELVPLDAAAALANPVTLHPIATDGGSGAAVDLAPWVSDERSLRTALMASACMPVLAGPPVEFAGRSWVDAGVVENIPFRSAAAGGATHQLVLRTRRPDEVVPPPSRTELRVAGRYLARRAPGALEPWLARHALRGVDETDLLALPAAVQIRPPVGSPVVSRTARDPRLLQRAVNLGREAALAVLAPVAGL